MRKIYRVAIVGFAFSLLFSFFSYADTVNVEECDSSLNQVSSSEAKQMYDSGQYTQGSATIGFNSQDAGGSGEESHSSGGTTTSGNNGSKQGNATISHDTSGTTTSVTSNKTGSGKYTTQTITTIETDRTSGNTVAKKDQLNWPNGDYSYIVWNQADTDDPNQSDKPTDSTPKSDLITSETSKLSTYAQDALNGSTVNAVKYNDGKYIVASKVDPDPQNPDDDDGSGNNGGSDASSMWQAVEESDDGNSTYIVKTQDEATLIKELREFRETVEKVKNGEDITQTTTKIIDGKEVTVYTIGEGDDKKEVRYWSEGYRSQYTIENLYYEWSLMGVDNPEEFGDVGRWHVGERTEVGPKKHVYSYTLTNWGNYKAKCDWHYIKHYYHYEYWTDDDGDEHRVRVWDGDEYCVDNVNNWVADVPLICNGCPPIRLCVGAGCENDCATSTNMVCDREHNPMSKVKTDTYTELVK